MFWTRNGARPLISRSWQCVGSQFTFSYCPYKLPTPVFCKLWFSSQPSNKTTLLFYMHFPTWPYSRFHDCKAWKLWLRSHIKNFLGLSRSLLSLCSLCFQFTYHCTIDKIPRSLLIWHFLFVNMTSFYKIVMIFFWSSLWCIGDLIYVFFDWFHWHIGFVKTHSCCG